MKKQLLLVMEAVQMNGAVMGWLGYLDAIDKSEWDMDVFLFDSDRHDGLTLPDYVRKLPDDIHCVIERVGLSRAITYTLARGRVDLALKRLWYSVMQRRYPRYRKWNLVKSAKEQPKYYDVAIGATMGASWEYVVKKVSARQKLIWLDTNYHFAPWPEYWKNFNWCIDHASALVCVSEATRDMMRRENPNWTDKIYTMNYVIDSDRICRLAREKSQLPEKKCLWRLVTVGRYCQQKGQYLIAPIARKLKEKNVSLEWHVVAPGCGRQMDSIMKDLVENGVEDVVFYHEGCSNPFAEMATADIYVQPSVFEGFGLTVSEAMITGKFVVATDIPEFREQITDNSVGILSALTVESFTEAIESAMRVVEGGKNCRDYKTPYTKARTYGQFIDILRRSDPGKQDQEAIE